MNQKEIQIEELTQEIEFAKKGLWNAENLKKEDYSWHSRGIAEHLFSICYRKIPEGSVVLTKEEYEKLTAPKVFISPKSLGKKEFEERIKNISNYGIIGVDESSIEIIPTRTDIKKETAKEIIELIKEMDGADLNYIAQKYGVEE